MKVNAAPKNVQPGKFRTFQPKIKNVMHDDKNMIATVYITVYACSRTDNKNAIKPEIKENKNIADWVL